jgi:hypothetical protein
MIPSRPTISAKLARLAAHTAVMVAVSCAGLWGLSCVTSVGMFTLGNGTSLRFTNGVAEVRHFYAYDVAPPVPRALWHDFAVAHGWTTPNTPGGRFAPPAFRFSAGHVAGVTGTPSSGRGATVSPANYWLMRVPLWPLIVPGLLVGAWRLAAWHHARRRSPRGFEVRPAPAPPA